MPQRAEIRKTRINTDTKDISGNYEHEKNFYEIKN